MLPSEEALHCNGRLAAGALGSAFNGKAVRLPSRKPALEVEYRLVARGEERGLALSGAWPDHAIERDTVGCVDLGDALRHLVERNIDGAWNMG